MLTAGYNGVINQRQFQFGRPYWPTDYRHPDEVYRDHHTLDGRRRDLGAAPRQGRDRRRHLGVEPGPQGALHRRPLHLGQPQLRQPAEGAALPARVGDRPPQDGRPRRRGAAARPRLPDPRRRPHRAGLQRRRRAARVAGRADAGADERGRPPRRHRRHGQGPRPPAREALPAAGVRRARVRRPQPLAPLRRLVRRQPGPPQAAHRRRHRRRDGVASPAGRRSWPSGRPSWPRPATSAWPATSPSWPRRRRPTTPACTRCAPRSSASGPPRSAARCPRASSAGPSARARRRPASTARTRSRGCCRGRTRSGPWAPPSPPGDRAR